MALDGLWCQVIAHYLLSNAYYDNPMLTTNQRYLKILLPDLAILDNAVPPLVREFHTYPMSSILL